MFYKFYFLIDGRIPFFLHYHPAHHPFSPVLNRQARALSGRALKNIGFVNFIFKGIRNPPVSNQVLVDFLNSV